MTPKDLAALLNGREYTEEITNAEAAQAKAAGLVVVFGASDDLMEFRGAINNELGAYGGTTAFVIITGLLVNECDNDRCPHFEALKKTAAKIKANWDVEDGGRAWSWTFETTIPHETFEIVEDGEPYCRGIVFALEDVGPKPDSAPEPVITTAMRDAGGREILKGRQGEDNYLDWAARVYRAMAAAR